MALQLTHAQVPVQVLRGQVLVQAHQGQLADLQVHQTGGQRVWGSFFREEEAQVASRHLEGSEVHWSFEEGEQGECAT